MNIPTVDTVVKAIVATGDAYAKTRDAVSQTADKLATERAPVTK